MMESMHTLYCDNPETGNHETTVGPFWFCTGECRERYAERLRGQGRTVRYDVGELDVPVGRWSGCDECQLPCVVNEANSALLARVLDLMDEAIRNGRYGPWVLHLRADRAALLGTSYCDVQDPRSEPLTLRDRLLQVEGIAGVVACERLNVYDMQLV